MNPSRSPSRTRPAPGRGFGGAPGRELGSVIGAVFGAVFVLINSIGFPAPARVAVVVLALVALATVLVSAFRLTRRRDSSETASASDGLPASDGQPASAGKGSPFGKAYWLVVVIEVVALIAGTQILTRTGLPELGVAWVAVIVGTHFFVLAVVFGLRRFHVVGALVTLAGVAGFVIRALGATDPVALVSGVGSGFILLAFSFWALARG